MSQHLWHIKVIKWHILFIAAALDFWLIITKYCDRSQPRRQDYCKEIGKYYMYIKIYEGESFTTSENLVLILEKME